MKYEARIMASKWVNGSGWEYENDKAADGWVVEADQVDAWKGMIKNGDRSLFDYIVDGLEGEEHDEDPDYSESDIKYTMELIEFDEDDIFGEEKVIASTSIWESKLMAKDK